jgi:hypothetical protein
MGPIGMVGLHPQPEPSPHGFTLQPELGYWLGRTFWGRGFATEAVRSVRDYAFTTLNLRNWPRWSIPATSRRFASCGRRVSLTSGKRCCEGTIFRIMFVPWFVRAVDKAALEKDFARALGVGIWGVPRRVLTPG